MSIWFKRSFVLVIFFVGAAVLMVQCAPASGPTNYPNGLTCQPSTNGGLDAAKSADCRFKCPDGRLLSLPQAVTKQSKDELNFLFCGVPLPTPTAGAQVGSANLTPTPPLASPLQQVVVGCDLTKHILEFEFTKSPPNLGGQALTVDVQDQPTQCSIPSGLPGIFACKIPAGITFPAGVVVKLNGQTVDLFPFTGFGCFTGQPTRIPHTATPPVTAQPTQAATQPVPTKPGPTQQPTQPPATQPPATQPPATQPAPTNPPATQPAPTSAPAPTSPPATSAPAPTTAAPAPTSPVPGLPLLTGLSLAFALVILKADK